MNSRYNFMNHDRELVRRGVIVPVFKTKPPTDILNFKFKDKYYLSYLKARSKVRALKLGSTDEWKKYCYLHTKLPHGVPESPEIVYRNSGWTSFKDWLGFTTIKKPLIKSKLIELFLYNEPTSLRLSSFKVFEVRGCKIFSIALLGASIKEPIKTATV